MSRMNDLAGLPDWIQEEAWKDWLEHRRQLGKPLTRVAERRLLGRLGQFKARGYDPNEMLERAMANGWVNAWPEDREQRTNGAAYREAPAPSLGSGPTEAGESALQNVRDILPRLRRRAES